MATITIPGGGDSGPNGTNLNNALAGTGPYAAQPGDIIILPAGGRYFGTILLPYRGDNIAPITIRSGNWSNFPVPPSSFSGPGGGPVRDRSRP